MSKRKKEPFLSRATRAANFRRCSQLLFFALFLWAFLRVLPHPDRQPPHQLSAWFRFDPLIALCASIAGRAFIEGAGVALVTVLLTVVLGRVFCGWICPLGAIHTFFSWLTSKWHRRRKGANAWSRWQLSKYYLLAVLLVMTLFGVNMVGVLDPFSVLYRSFTTGLMPAVQWSVEEGSTAIYQADPTVGSLHLKAASEPVYTYLRDHIFNVPEQAFFGGGFVLLLFILTVGLNAWKPRFWCRYVCPLGALLGLLAIRPILRRNVKAEDCSGCDLCGLDCQGAASSAPGTGWKSAECLGCMSCSGSTCPKKGLTFSFAAPWKKAEGSDRPVSVTRRALLASVAGGAAGVAMVRVSPAARGTVYTPTLLRPPGALDERAFLEKCISCGLCMKICPNGALHPTLLEAGVEGIWTPRFVPQVGHCDPECTRCGHVCPTGAIQPLTPEERAQVRIGLAAFDTTRCIPYAYGRECMVCEEHCPVTPKAIYFNEEDVTLRDGTVARIKLPRVDPDQCIGCGICENVCPYKDRPAIRISSANESRHPGNQPILPGAAYY